MEGYWDAEPRAVRVLLIVTAITLLTFFLILPLLLIFWGALAEGFTAYFREVADDNTAMTPSGSCFTSRSQSRSEMATSAEAGVAAVISSAIRTGMRMSQW